MGDQPHFLASGLSHRETPRDLSQFRRDEPDKEETLQFAPEVLPVLRRNSSQHSSSLFIQGSRQGNVLVDL